MHWTIRFEMLKLHIFDKEVSYQIEMHLVERQGFFQECYAFHKW